MKKLLTSLCLLFATSANATILITPDNVFTSLTAFNPFSVEQTIDDVLFGHGNGFVVDGDNKAGVFQFGFDQSQQLVGFNLYNDAGVSPREGIKKFTLNFFDSSNALLNSIENLETNPSNRLSSPDVFLFSEAQNDVARVDLVVLDSYDDGNLSRVQLQFTEVQFISNVPVPGSIWLLVSGLFGLIKMRRKGFKFSNN